MKPPLSGWLGGKSRLVKQLLPLIPEHTCYVEAFAGAGWLLFGKEESKVEVLNDRNSELTTLYRVLQNHIEEFLRYFKWILVSREDFNRWLTAKPEALTDVQRAARFYYLTKNSFGGRCDRPTFGTSCTNKPRLNLVRIEDDLSAAYFRLQRVVIECLPYADILSRYDRPETFFYLDPPYWGNEGDYGKGLFERADYARLARLVSATKGKFLLSINDTPEIRKLFDAFSMMPIQTSYSTNSYASPKRVRELLISNY